MCDMCDKCAKPAKIRGFCARYVCPYVCLCVPMCAGNDLRPFRGKREGRRMRVPPPGAVSMCDKLTKQILMREGGPQIVPRSPNRPIAFELKNEERRPNFVSVR